MSQRKKRSPNKRQISSMPTTDIKSNRADKKAQNRTEFIDLSFKLIREQVLTIKIQAVNREMSRKAMLIEALKLYFNTYPMPGLPKL